MNELDKYVAEILAKPKPKRVDQRPPPEPLKPLEGGRTEPPKSVQVGLSAEFGDALRRVDPREEVERFVRVAVKDRQENGVTLQVDYKKRQQEWRDERRRELGLPSLEAAKAMRECQGFIAPAAGPPVSGYDPFARFDAELPSLHGRTPGEAEPPLPPHVPRRGPLTKSVLGTKLWNPEGSDD